MTQKAPAGMASITPDPTEQLFEQLRFLLTRADKAFTDPHHPRFFGEQKDRFGIIAELMAKWSQIT